MADIKKDKERLIAEAPEATVTPELIDTSEATVSPESIERTEGIVPPVSQPDEIVEHSSIATISDSNEDSPASPQANVSNTNPSDDDEDPPGKIWLKAFRLTVILFVVIASLGYVRTELEKYANAERDSKTSSQLPLTAGSFYAAWVGDPDMTGVLQSVRSLADQEDDRTYANVKGFIDYLTANCRTKPMPFSWATMGVAAISRDEPDAALKYAQRLVDAYPDRPIAHFGKAYALMSAGNSQDAIKEIKAGWDLREKDRIHDEMFGDTATWADLYAESLLTGGRPQEALQVYVNHKPLSIEDIVFKARCELALLHPDQAISILKQVDSTDAGGDEEKLVMIEALMIKGDVKGAQKFADRYKGFVQFDLLLSRAYELTDPKRALDYAKDALKHQNTPKAYYQLARAQNKAGLYKDALLTCHSYMTNDPLWWGKMHVQRSIALAGLGQANEAVREASGAIRFNPRLGCAYNALASALDQVGNHHEAANCRERAKHLPED